MAYPTMWLVIFFTTAAAIQLDWDTAATSDTSSEGQWTRIAHTDSSTSQTIILDIPLGDIQALAAGATRVRINSLGDLGDGVVSTANSWPIEDVRLGRTIAEARTLTSAQASAVWSGARVSHMEKVCQGGAAGLDTKIHHACGNTNGLHWNSGKSSWLFDTSLVDLELYIDATAPTPAPTPAPTLAPTPAPTPVTTPTAASATGDPHLQNLHGERFDLTRPGKFALIHVPRGQPVEDALLVVEADARQLGGRCTDLYFVELNVTGKWAEADLQFNAQGVHGEKPTWAKFGPVELKVAHGRTEEGLKFLNFYVKHLGRAGAAVGGLLGEDDHTEAAKPDDRCYKTVALEKNTQKTAKRQGEVSSVAMSTSE